jgi:beta-phosphoglucomutase-like phosphatase (HAD superfamily)/uncharacterized protein YciI
MWIVELAFTDEPERLAARPAHRELLTALHAEGTVRMSGPLADDPGAVLVFDVPDRGTLDRLLDGDPYFRTPGVQVALRSGSGRRSPPDPGGHPRVRAGWVTTDAVVFDPGRVIVDSEPVWEEVRRAYVDARRHLAAGQPAPADGDEHGRVGRIPQRRARRRPERRAGRRGGGRGDDPAVRERVPLIDWGRRGRAPVGARWPLGLQLLHPAGRGGARATDLTDAYHHLSTEETERGKPAPDVYLAVAGRLGVDPARCVAVEDSSNGVRSAAAAGMRVIAVPHGAYPLDPDAEALAAVVLPSIGELTVETVDRLD